MENNPAVIRQEMQDTRNALTEKLEALEQHVLGTVQNATCAVQDTVCQVKEAVLATVSHVKDSIDDTVGTVKETFDLELQVRRHPWAMVGGAVCLGYLGGYVVEQLGPRAGPQDSAALTSAGVGADRVTERPQADRRGTTSGWTGALHTSLEPEIDMLKGIAIGALFNVVKDVSRRWVPQTIEPQMHEWLDNVTRKLGGKPVEGSLVDELQSAYR